MEKQDLRKAAYELAAEEFFARLMYDSFRQGAKDISSDSLSSQAGKVSAARKKVDEIRSQIPELSGKQYWWDIPFDIRNPLTEFEDTFVFGQAGFTEQPEFELGVAEIKPQIRRMRGDEILSLYLSHPVDPVLYMDRKGFKSHLSDQMEVRTLFMYETGETGSSGAGGSYGVLPGSWEYNQWKRDLATVSGRLSSDLARHNDNWDMLERIASQSFFTNRERFFMGQMDADDFFTWDLIRENRAKAIAERADQRRVELESRIRKAEYDYGRRQFREMESARKEFDILRVLPCGRVIRMGEQVMAVTLHASKHSVYELRHRGEISPSRLGGRIISANDILFKTPAPVPVIDFIIQKYTPLMKQYRPLAARPKGASDQLWRVWAERRFAYEMSLRYKTK